MTNAVINDMLQKGWELHNSGKLDEAERIYQGIFCRAPSDAQLMYLLGDIYLKRGWNGMAINLFSLAVSLKPDYRPAFINLGCAFKAEHYNDLAEGAWMRALEIEPSAEIYNNLSTLYADSCRPDEALEMAQKAIAILPAEQDHHSPHISWNRALALLSRGEWKEGWIEHEARKKLKAKACTPRDYAPEWDGKTFVNRLIVHGEQGVGDEMMFLTCLKDLRAAWPTIDLTVECERRLVPIVERSFGVKAYPTMDDAKSAGTYDAQIALGTLPMLYRNHDSDFRDPVWMIPNPELMMKAYEMLEGKPRPWVATAFVGGTKETRVHHRSIALSSLKSMIPGTIVALQHGPMADVEVKNNGLDWYGEWADGKDLEKQSALMAVCDLVITVCGTPVHMAGVLGKEAIVLTPLRSSWRYGMKSGKGAMLWYPQHTLLRQKVEGEWEPVFEELKKEIDKRYA